jgi:hypothetical protein
LTAHRDEFLGEAGDVVHYFSLVCHCDPPGTDEAPLSSMQRRRV